MNGSEFLGFSLLRPESLVWLLGAPLLFALGWWGLATRRRDLRRMVAPRHFAKFAPRASHLIAAARVFLAGAAALFLGLAVLGPVRGYSLRDVERKGLDLVVCLDTSRSMLVEDLRPSRLERAKREITGLLQKLKGDRVAVLAFAGDVRRVAPLTHDRSTLTAFISTLSPKDNMLGGTTAFQSVPGAGAYLEP